MPTPIRYNRAPDYSLWSATELRDEARRLQRLTDALQAEITRRKAPFAHLTRAAADEHATWPGAA